jgi:hypothetical protein
MFFYSVIVYLNLNLNLFRKGTYKRCIWVIDQIQATNWWFLQNPPGFHFMREIFLLKGRAILIL